MSKKNHYVNMVKTFKQAVTPSILCLLLMLLSGIYITHIHPEILESNQKMALIGTVIIISVLINFFIVINFYKFQTLITLAPQLIYCILPFAMCSIILSPLLGLRVAHYVGIFVSIITAMQLQYSFSVMINGMFLCSIAGYVVRNSPNHRSYFLKAMCVIAVITPLLALPKLWDAVWSWDIFIRIVILGLLNGLITSILSLGILFILEIIFQISSDMTLLLLCDYNHPLLKRLQLEAPGTYHHSLMVSTLAEQAAQAIGANPIKARVIALFHDIGKIDKPLYFTENQHNNENKHNRLTPKMSSLVILNHVKDGTDLALKYKLRKIIRDGIQQHHGTDIIAYFYHQAIEEARLKGTTVNENDYRYPGPLPREKEVVILSLADAAEAATRSLQKPSANKIDALIWEIFRNRIRTGQLDNADLTFSELTKIRNSFVTSLTTMYHSRISYQKDNEEKKNENDLFMGMPQQKTEQS